MVKLVSILAMSDEERILALSLLDETAGSAGAYVSGTLKDSALPALRASGLLFNIEPDAAPPPDGIELTRHRGARLEASDEPRPVVLSFNVPLNLDRQSWLDNRGISLARKLGPASYLAHVPESRLEELSDRPDWFTVGRYGLRATLGDSLGQRAVAPAPRAQLESAELRAYDLSCHDPSSLDTLAAHIGLLSPTLKVERGEDRLRIWVDAGSELERRLLLLLGERSDVSEVEEYVPPELFLSFATAALVGQAASPLSPLKWRGEGQVIGVADSGIDAAHPDFAGRLEVVLRVPPMSDRDPRGHGTHVASIAAGSGEASGGELAGVAPKARLFVQSLVDDTGRFDIGLGVTPLLREAYAKQVRIQNLSWGSPVASRYTLDARALDAFVYRNSDMLIVIAAGNSGEQVPEDDGIGRNSLHSIASPASAKNCLTVGACCSPRTDGPYAGRKWREYDGLRPPQRMQMADLPLTGQTDIVAALSSRGPSDDGRVKPDLVVPGVGVAAALAADHDPRHPYEPLPDLYHFMSGTSMAAPLVAGAAAIVRQYLIEERDHRPSAALIKAILINGAYWVPGVVWEDSSIGVPNFHQGFGRLELARAIPLDESAGFALKFADVAENSPTALIAMNPLRESSKVRFTLSESQPLSVTLVWTDPPGRGLQHELDLVLVAPSGTRYIGNADLRRLPFEAFDRRNNVEQVRVAMPETGEWEAHVFAKNTHRGPQGFALALTGPLA
jgi:hypothetical protein